MKAYITLLIIIFFGFHSEVSGQNDSSKESYIPFVDLLEVGEQYEIVIQSVGCFHNRQQSLFIFREEKSFIAALNDSEITLNGSKVDALRKFERQLKYVGAGGCTTVDTYILKYGPERAVYNDDTCSRFFGRVLLDELGFSS